MVKRKIKMKRVQMKDGSGRPLFNVVASGSVVTGSLTKTEARQFVKTLRYNDSLLPLSKRQHKVRIMKRMRYYRVF